MGICSSCDSTDVATAKLILHDGRLQEFSYPVKVSHVLHKYQSYFICNSDEMDFDGVVSAVSNDDVLQPGQLYFALPLSRLRSRLQAEDMAALAVKASSALAKSGGDKCGGCGKKPVLAYSSGEKGFSGAAPTAKVGDFGEVRAKRERRSGGGRGSRGSRSDFTALLSAIPE